MCDTVCVRLDDRTLFAKNSDRPVGEVQLLETHGRRAGSGPLRTQYLIIDDADTAALVGSRPAWLWGFEHGINEHRVAIGNERVFTVDDAGAAPKALIGMDLVRLGLERAATAEAAVDVMTDLLAEHGQGGIADAANGEAYFSSFLVADPVAAWVLETSGRTWAAEPVTDGAAISNRLALGAGWTKASSDVAPGRAFDEWRDPAWPALADVRLACTRPAVRGPDRVTTPAELAALLRHHGGRPWGRPGEPFDRPDPLPPARIGAGAEGFSVCMHLRGYQVTAAAMICDLPADPEAVPRAWFALGSPCSSVFVPAFPPDAVPAAMGRERPWRRFSALAARVESGETTLDDVRARLGPLETELWQEADAVAGHGPRAYAEFVEKAWSRVASVLDTWDRHPTPPA